MSTAISISGWRSASAPPGPWTGSTWRCGPARSTGSSAPTAPARPPPSGSCSPLLRPDAGQAGLLGGDLWRDAVAPHRRLAYVPGDVALWPNLSGGEVIDLLARLRGGLDPTRRAELLDRFDLDPRKKARTHSKGNRQKVALVAALASDVELLLLDEPTSGLDLLMEARFRELIADERHSGRTVLLSSHILAEAEALCDRVSIVRAGRTVESGTLAELRHLTRTSIVAELAGGPDVAGRAGRRARPGGGRHAGALPSTPPASTRCRGTCRRPGCAA